MFLPRWWTTYWTWPRPGRDGTAARQRYPSRVSRHGSTLPTRQYAGWLTTLSITSPSSRPGYTGRPTEPDRWHASAITTPADLAAFTADDLDEARSRLRRLALIWDVRLRSLSDQQLDDRSGDAWTPRQLAFHLADSAFYADSIGILAP